MSYDTETARRYHEHAARLRRMAAADEDPKTRKALMQIAQDYESMARVHETTEVNNVTNVIYVNAGAAPHKA